MSSGITAVAFIGMAALRSNIANMTRSKEAHLFLQVLGATGARVNSTARWQFPPGGRILR